MTLQAQSAIGLVAIPLIAWVLSERRSAIAPARLARLLLAGLGLQLVIAGIMLNVAAVRVAFDWAAGLVTALQAATAAGMRLVFGYLAGAPAPFETVQPAEQLHPGVPCAAADPGDQRALQAALSLGRAAEDRARHRLGAAPHARRLGTGRHVGGGQHLRRHGGGAAAGAALPRHHEPRGPVRHHDGGHGGRGRHGARHLRHHPAAGGAGRGGPPDRRVRHQRAGGAHAVGADGAGKGRPRPRHPDEPTSSRS